MFKPGTLQTNQFTTSINTRATREFDAKIEMGVFSLVFKRGGHVKLCIDANIREGNKQVLVDIERKVKDYLFEPVTFEVLSKLAADIEPLVKRIEFVQ